MYLELKWSAWNKDRYNLPEMEMEIKTLLQSLPFSLYNGAVEGRSSLFTVLVFCLRFSRTDLVVVDTFTRPIP